MAALTAPALASGLSHLSICGDRVGSASRQIEEANVRAGMGVQDLAELQMRLTTAGVQLRQCSRHRLHVLPSQRFRFARLRSDAFRGSSGSLGGFQGKQRRFRMTFGGAEAFATEEASVPRDEAVKSLEVSFYQDSLPRSIPRPPKNRADDASLHNPLLRLERMGCGWFGAIFEWDGVIVEDDLGIEKKAWTALAKEEGKRPPPAFILNRAEGMKNEQAIAEVLCWSRDPRQLKRLAQRKEELYHEMQGGIYRCRAGSREFVLTLTKYKIPMAMVSTRPRKILERAIEAVDMESFFGIVVTAEDVYRAKPDPEMFLYAAQLLDIIPDRCIVFGNSNSSVEAAHDAYMKCIAVAGKHPIFELGAADLVVRSLDDLSLVDLKNLADLDSPEFQPPEPEPELEPEENDPAPQTHIGSLDFW